MPMGTTYIINVEMTFFIPPSTPKKKAKPGVIKKTIAVASNIKATEPVSIIYLLNDSVRYYITSFIRKQEFSDFLIKLFPHEKRPGPKPSLHRLMEFDLFGLREKGLSN